MAGLTRALIAIGVLVAYNADAQEKFLTQPPFAPQLTPGQAAMFTPEQLSNPRIYATGLELIIEQVPALGWLPAVRSFDPPTPATIRTGFRC